MDVLVTSKAAMKGTVGIKNENLFLNFVSTEFIFNGVCHAKITRILGRFPWHYPGLNPAEVTPKLPEALY